MKSFLILMLGCVPLGALTARSFVELTRVDERFQLPLEDASRRDAPRLSVETRAQLETDRPLVRELAQADLFGAEPIPGLASAPATSNLKSLGESWPKWIRARTMVTAVLEVEQTAAAAELEQLQEASGQLKALIAEYERSPPRGSQRLLRLLGRRRSTLQRRISRRELQRNGLALVERARTAFQPYHYEECMAICDQLLADYVEVLDASILGKVRVLKTRARFWSDAERLDRQLPAATTPAMRVAALRGFLDGYSSPKARTASEVQVLQQREQELRALESRIQAAEQSRTGTRRIAEFHEDLPEGFPQRLAGALEILEEYPVEAVKRRVRDDVRRWLAELVPEKSLQEPPDLRETETTGNRVVRGFFREVKGIDGGVSGYKCYPTHEELLHPRSAVGIYPVDSLLAAPAASVLRRCAERFNRARQQWLDRPHDRQTWTQLAELCDRLEDELRRYRDKPGSSREPLSFAEDAALLQHLSEELDQGDLERAFEL